MLHWEQKLLIVPLLEAFLIVCMKHDPCVSGEMLWVFLQRVWSHLWKFGYFLAAVKSLSLILQSKVSVSGRYSASIAECVINYISLVFVVVVTAVDEQNAQTSASTSSLAEAIVTVAASAAGEVVTTSTARIEEELEPVQGICVSMIQTF